MVSFKPLSTLLVYCIFSLRAKAQIGLKRYSAALSELEGSPATPHKALVLLANFLRADPSRSGDATRENVAEQAKTLVDNTLSEEQEATPESALMASTCATILVHAVCPSPASTLSYPTLPCYRAI